MSPGALRRLAQVNTGNGSVELATKEITLDVADSFFNFTFPKASTEQGQESTLLVNVEVKQPFEGTATVKLQGLPAGATSSADLQPLTAESSELVFPISIAKDARTGQHKTLVCRATITRPGGEIVQTQGTGTLQIDKPLEAAPAPKAEKKSEEKKQEAKPKEPPKKPLTRLEQLRLMKKQKLQSGG